MNLPNLVIIVMGHIEEPVQYKCPLLLCWKFNRLFEFINRDV